MKKVFLLGLVGTMIALFSACNAYTQINSTTDPKANFLTYKTFAWLVDKADSTNEFVALPVVDRHYLIGLLTAHEVMEVLAKEKMEDVYYSIF